MDIISVYIGSRIEEVRSHKKITQIELAKKLGLSRVSVVNMEAGRQGISAQRLFELSEILECRVTYLLPTEEWYKDNKNKKVRKKVIIEIYE